jgi:hypothetical protein
VTILATEGRASQLSANARLRYHYRVKNDPYSKFYLNQIFFDIDSWIEESSNLRGGYCRILDEIALKALYGCGSGVELLVKTEKGTFGFFGQI